MAKIIRAFGNGFHNQWQQLFDHRHPLQRRAKMTVTFRKSVVNITRRASYCLFPRCFWCCKYSPFLFLIGTPAATECFKSFLEGELFLVCAVCLPSPSKLGDPTKQIFPQRSLLRNEEFVALFEGFEFEDPYFHPYAALDVLILTEETRINASHRPFIRKPLPKQAKLQKLLNAVPPVHRMTFCEYPNPVQLSTYLARKYDEIAEWYSRQDNLSFLHDNFDVMTERTPMHERRSAGSQSRATNARQLSGLAAEEEPRFAEDSLVARQSDRSASESNSDAISSQSIELASQEIQNPSKESINISSQSLDVRRELLPIPDFSESLELANQDSPEPGPSGLQQQHQQQRGNDIEPIAFDSSSSSDLSTITTLGVGTRRSASRNRSPQPQQQSTGAKRRRVLPMNPSPNDVTELTRGNHRMPRLPGG
ncbi:uncharacterized protein LOC128275656 [Anopheles cruzii]|uniref:uncharacterized protein LOC128275656 n=1 Tax=Anopheles cruzii TaxID=68878 RepID=UPI0022EC5BCD|nr:uncharacterized protein LOC128275656 [Anopheles cruzii]